MSEQTILENNSEDVKNVNAESKDLGRKTLTITKDENRIFTFDYPGDAGVAELELISFSLFSKIFNYKYEVPMKPVEKADDKVKNKPTEEKDLKE